jgi:lysophospholipase L1-like esterase
MGALVFAVSFVLAGGLAECATRSMLPEGYFVWPPGFHMTFDAGEVIRHGVSFPAHLSINALGMRGELPPDGVAHRMLAVGGSTTVCVYLDDAHAWPLLLQRRLNGALSPGTVWVGNVGRPGHKTSHHILQVEKLLAQYPEVDVVILLLGFNDFVPHLTALTYPTLALEPTPQQQLAMAFSVYPGWGADAPWYRRNLIGRALWRLSWRPLPGTEELQPMDAKGDFQATLRHHRQRAGRLLERLPRLGDGIAAYVANVARIVDAARARDVRVVLVTQPTLWRPGLSEHEQALLWGGGPPFYALSEGADYYAVETLAEGMARYNRALLRVCSQRGGLCIDAASELPRTSQVFFDDAHFTEAGSAQLAELIARRLLADERLGLRERSRRASLGAEAAAR